MNSKNGNKDHPEIQDIKHICDISPDLKETKDVCETLKKNHSNVADKNSSSEQKKKNPLEDSANPGNQYISENGKPKNIEKKGFNNSPKPIK